MLNRIKQALPPNFKRRIKHAMGTQDMETRLRNLRACGFECASAVDVGAFVGDWSVLANSCFGCTTIAIEPQPSRQPVLHRLAKRIPLRVENVALAERAGELPLVLEDTNSRLRAGRDDQSALSVLVKIDRLDALLERHSDLQPNLLKLDVQGHELKVLDGAGASLNRFEVIVMEVSIIRIGPVPVFHEVLEYMRLRDFRLYDFLPMYYRPRDGALWQADAFFVRDDSPLVASESWA